MGKWVWVLRFLFWDEKGSRQGYWILTKKGEDGEALDDCWESLVLALHVV